MCGDISALLIYEYDNSAVYDKSILINSFYALNKRLLYSNTFKKGGLP